MEYIRYTEDARIYRVDIYPGSRSSSPSQHDVTTPNPQHNVTTTQHPQVSQVAM